MILFLKDIFSRRTKKISIIRRIQIFSILIIFVSNFTAFNIKKVDLLIYNFLSPLGLLSNIINVKIDQISNKISLIKNVKDIELLKSENDRLRNELSIIKMQQNELNDFKLLSKHHHHFLDTVNIISVIKNTQKYLIGSFSNAVDVNINDLILNQNNFLVGRVITVNKNSKIIKIQLIDDSYFSIPVYGYETRQSGLLNNNKRLTSCDLEFFSLTKDTPTEGELVLTSPEDGLIAPDIKIGYITKKNDYNCIKNDVNLLRDKIFIVKNIFTSIKFD